MRSTYLLLILCWLALPVTLHAQIGGSVFDVTKKAQQKAKGEADNEAEQQEEDQQMEDFEKGLDNFTKNLGIFRTESMVGKCLSIMSEHASSLAELQNQFDETDNCKKKKEYIEAQSLVLISGGTIIYCPDELNSDKAAYGAEIYEFMQPFILISGDLFQILDEFEKVSNMPLEDRQKLGPPLYKKFKERLRKIEKEFQELTEEESEKTLLITEILSKFLYAELKFGNEYYLSSMFKIHPTNFSYIKDLEMFYANIVNYFTYYLSPKEFMAKRAEEINFIRNQLPCE